MVSCSLCSNVTAVSCGYPPSISNGFRGTLTRTTYGGTVTYSCYTGYQMSGSDAVTCQASGSWSARPNCEGDLIYMISHIKMMILVDFDSSTAICPPLTLINGNVTYSPSGFPIIERTLANISCNSGYQLSGSEVQRCENNGMSGVWSGQAFCEGLWCVLRSTNLMHAMT